MADQGTIRAKFRADGSEFKGDLDDIKRNAKQAGGEISRLFALEPLGVRRGQRAITRLAEAMASATRAGQDGVQAVTQFGAALSIGFAGGAVVGTVSAIAQGFIAAQKETIKLQEDIHDLGTRAAAGPEFRPLEALKTDVTDTGKKIKEVQDRLLQMGVASSGGGNYHRIGGFFGQFGSDISNQFTSALHGQTTGQREEELRQDILDLQKAAASSVDNEEKKMNELLDVEEKRYHVGQLEGNLLQEDIKNRETLLSLAEEAKYAGVSDQPAQQAENRRFQFVTDKMREQQRELDRQYQTKQQLANIEKLSVNLLNNATGSFEKQNIESRTGLALAQERLRAAEGELSAAEAIGNREGIRGAQLGVAEAQTGVAKAAGGAGETAVSQFERGAAEFNMTPAQKAAQYAQRFEQYKAYQRYADAIGIGRGIIPRPVYGATEYDPLAGYRALQSGGSQQGPGADLTLREQVKSGMFDTAGPQIRITTPQEMATATNAEYMLRHYPGLATTPYMDVPLVSPYQQAAERLATSGVGLGGANKPDTPQSFADTIAKAIANVFREFWGN